MAQLFSTSQLHWGIGYAGEPGETPSVRFDPSKTESERRDLEIAASEHAKLLKSEAAALRF
jgi:hypothetical protein